MILSGQLFSVPMWTQQGMGVGAAQVHRARPWHKEVLSPRPRLAGDSNMV